MRGIEEGRISCPSDRIERFSWSSLGPESPWRWCRRWGSNHYNKKG